MLALLALLALLATGASEPAERSELTLDVPVYVATDINPDVLESALQDVAQIFAPGSDGCRMLLDAVRTTLTEEERTSAERTIRMAGKATGGSPEESQQTLGNLESLMVDMA